MEAHACILNVDDNAGARYIKTRILQQAGFDVVEASTGNEALLIVKEQTPDLVLLDVKLPDINGMDVCKRIKTDSASSSTLVLQTSAALIGRDDKIRALESGADNYLVAPFEAEELVANVNALLRLRKAQQDLKLTETRRLALANATTDAVYCMNADWTELLQLDGHGFLSTTSSKNKNWLNEYIYPEDHATVLSAIQEAIRTKSTFELEHRIKRADGNVGWTHSRAIPIFDANGDLAEWFGAASDMTERMQYAERLREANQRIQLALDAGAIAGTWFWDIVEDRFTADSRFARSFGIAESALEKGLQLCQVVQSIHPDDEPGVQALVSETIATGGAYRTEYRVRQSDGNYRWVEANGHVTRDEHGKALTFPGVLVDVHHRKLVELRQTALLQLGDRLRFLEEPQQIAAAAADILGRTLEVALAGYGTIDTTQDSVEILSDWRSDTSIPSVIGHHQLATYGSYINDLKQGKAVAISDVRVDPRTAPHHEAFKALNTYSLLNVPLMNANGLSAVCLAHAKGTRSWAPEDIAFAQAVADRTWAAMTRAQATQALRRMNEELELLAAQRTADRNRLWQLSKALMLVTDLQGNISAVNPAWHNLLGWSETDLIGIPFRVLLHPEDQARTMAASKQIRDGEVTILPAFENRYRHRDGSYRWINWSATLGEDCVISVGRDVTEEKLQAEALMRAQEQLRQSQKMEAVGQLTGGLAHDFNNLLAGISGNLEMIGLTLELGKPEKLQRFIESAQNACDRAAALTHRLLSFSRRQTLDARATNATRLVHGMEELVRRTIGPGINLTIATDIQLWPIFVDAPQLETALLNLCINARDAMPEGGDLRIEMANRQLEDKDTVGYELPPGPYVTVRVTDSGTGMTPKVMAQAFEPFFTTKPLGQGTGLGLSMVYGFARQSGGFVSIESEVGRGTSVSLHLPRHDEEEEPIVKHEAAQSIRARNELTVLVVDDEPTIRLSTIALLNELGYIVLEAATGAEALQILQSATTIDLLITDVGLPGNMNGRQLADAARVRRADLKVLFITGYAEAIITSTKTLEAGMQTMVKPFTFEQFSSRIHDMLSDH